NNYNLGIVSEKFTAKSLADKLSGVTRSDLETFKKNANRAAADLNAEVNAKKINAMISKILS
ncbi:MAG TPA: hypothetical protein VEW65_03850, partial [Chryseolinea sp.]|nr:hypothetical protein [Chryseolinea sp.]